MTRDPGVGAFSVPHFCRGGSDTNLATQADFRVSNWAPRKARTQPKCENGWILLKNQIDTFWLPGN